MITARDVLALGTKMAAEGVDKESDSYKEVLSFLRKLISSEGTTDDVKQASKGLLEALGEDEVSERDARMIAKAFGGGQSFDDYKKAQLRSFRGVH